MAARSRHRRRKSAWNAASANAGGNDWILWPDTKMPVWLPHRGANAVLKILRAPWSGLGSAVFAQVPPRVEYALTESSLALCDIIEAMQRWGERWVGPVAG